MGAWTGGVVGATVPTTGSLFVPLWTNLDAQAYNMPGRGVHRYTHITLCARPNANSQDIHLLYWYVKVFQTDGSGVVPTQLVPTAYTPTIGDLPLMVWDVDQFGAVGSSSTTGLDWDGSQKGKRHSIDIKAKRRIDDTEYIALVLSVNTPNTFAVHIVHRTYVSW